MSEKEETTPEDKATASNILRIEKELRDAVQEDLTMIGLASAHAAMDNEQFADAIVQKALRKRTMTAVALIKVFFSDGQEGWDMLEAICRQHWKQVEAVSIDSMIPENELPV